jgi:hypothetical protein
MILIGTRHFRSRGRRATGLLLALLLVAGIGGGLLADRTTSPVPPPSAGFNLAPLWWPLVMAPLSLPDLARR